MPDDTRDTTTAAPAAQAAPAAPDPATFPRRRSPVLPRLRAVNLRKFSRVLQRLGTSEDAVAALPQITPYITQTLKLPRADVLSYLRMSSDPEIQRWLAIFDREDLLDAVRQIIPYECICAAAGITPSKLLEALGAQIVASGARRSAITAAMHHPEVVEATIGYALTEAGIQDRITLHKAVGFLPQPKSAQTTINVMANAQANAAAQADARTFEAPKPEATIRGLVDAFHEARTGESLRTVPMPQQENTEPALGPLALGEGGDSEDEYVPSEMPRDTHEPAPVPVTINAQAPAREMSREFAEAGEE